MGDRLDQPVLDQTTLPAVLALVAQLRTEVRQLRDDVARLQRENQSQWSGQLAAMMFTLLATLTRWKINPRRWLVWYLESCAQAGGNAPVNVASFLPWNITPQKLRELRQDPAPAEFDLDSG